MSLKRILHAFCQEDLLVLNEKLRVPVFNIQPSNVCIIKSPHDFYQNLKDYAANSKKRISISSLYLGTSHLERELVSIFSEAKTKHDQLDVNILLDYNRATRETFDAERQEVNSSRSLLTPLVGQGANVNMYLTYRLSGWWRQWIQRTQKWNELCALHHMKLYIFDDNLIISGANLSDLYFTNRQDRYLLIRNSPHICDYFEQLIKVISKFSLSLQADGNFSLNPQWKYDPRKYFHQRLFRIAANKEIVKLNDSFCAELDQLTQHDTIVFPLLQMKSIGVSDEEQFTSSLLQHCPSNSQLNIATGYFNLTKQYQQVIANRLSRYPISLLMASEEANGFFNGKGLLNYIPLVYTTYVRAFLKNTRRNSLLSLYYYNRPEWSFHGKGIWLLRPSYFLTMVGSTNFGYRSVYRDNEAQIVLITKNQDLQQSFEEEYQSLQAQSREIRQKQDLPTVPLWVQCFANVFRSYF